jgi:hypothetical protein
MCPNVVCKISSLGPITFDAWPTECIQSVLPSIINLVSIKLYHDKVKFRTFSVGGQTEMRVISGYHHCYMNHDVNHITMASFVSIIITLLK